MSKTSFDDSMWCPDSAYLRTDTSSESSESIDWASERTALLPDDRKQNGVDYKSASVYDEESTEPREVESQLLPIEQPTKSVFAIIGLLLIGESC